MSSSSICLCLDLSFPSSNFLFGEDAPLGRVLFLRCIRSVIFSVLLLQYSLPPVPMHTLTLSFSAREQFAIGKIGQKGTERRRDQNGKDGGSLSLEQTEPSSNAQRQMTASDVKKSILSPLRGKQKSRCSACDRRGHQLQKQFKNQSSSGAPHSLV